MASTRNQNAQPAGHFSMQRLLFTLLLLALAWPCLAAGDRLLFYQIQTRSSQVWLLGSMHLARADIYPLRQDIMRAFEQAEALVVEVDISGGRQQALRERMLSLGSYPPGQSIHDDLGAATWNQLEARLAAVGLAPSMMERLRPGLVVTTLSTMEMMRLGLNPELGIDRYFLSLARADMPVIELETAAQQIALLLDFPRPELLVQQTLVQLDDLEPSMNRLIALWRAGDAAGLRKLVIDDELREHPEFRPLHKRMFDDRNRAMTDRIVALQHDGGSYFVVVGAGHLLGDQGIIAMLERRGRKPRQL